MSDPDNLLTTMGDGPRRAKDFVKCADPECWLNKQFKRHNDQRISAGAEPWKQDPHCHPVF